MSVQGAAIGEGSKSACCHSCGIDTHHEVLFLHSGFVLSVCEKCLPAIGKMIREVYGEPKDVRVERANLN